MLISGELVMCLAGDTRKADTRFASRKETVG